MGHYDHFVFWFFWCLPGKIFALEQLGYHQESIEIIVYNNSTVHFSAGAYTNMGHHLHTFSFVLPDVPVNKKTSRLFKTGVMTVLNRQMPVIVLLRGV